MGDSQKRSVRATSEASSGGDAEVDLSVVPDLPSEYKRYGLSLSKKVFHSWDHEHEAKMRDFLEEQSDVWTRALDVQASLHDLYQAWRDVIRGWQSRSFLPMRYWAAQAPDEEAQGRLHALLMQQKKVTRDRTDMDLSLFRRLYYDFVSHDLCPAGPPFAGQDCCGRMIDKFIKARFEETPRMCLRRLSQSDYEMIRGFRGRRVEAFGLLFTLHTFSLYADMCDSRQGQARMQSLLTSCVPRLLEAVNEADDDPSLASEGLYAGWSDYS